MSSAQGRDYSAFQKPVTPATLAGLHFAYTRVSDWSRLALATDPSFASDWAAMKAAGLHRGAYWYLLLHVDPAAQAQYFVAAVKKAGLLPGDQLVCDSEELATSVDDVTLAFQREVLALTGWPAALIPTYSNLNTGKHLVKTSQEFPTLWLGWPSAVAPVPAQWAPARWKTWTFWQYGTAGGVDADAFNGSPAQLDAWITSHLAEQANRATPLEVQDMIIVNVDKATVPAGTQWPGYFLLTGAPPLYHIKDTAELAAWEALGVPVKVRPYSDWLLLGGKPAAPVSA